MVDYSKWKDIEISDDEDETHPNIDTPSLFRWRHQARLERMAEQKNEKEAFELKKNKHKKRVDEVKLQLEEARNKNLDTEDLQKTLNELEKESEELKKEEENLHYKEKITPWNVDTISQPGFTKTVFNKKNSYPKELTEEEKDNRFKLFVKENESLIKQYGMLRKYEDSKRFLQDNPKLVCEDTANYLVVWCINLEMEEKHYLMEHVAHQCICMQYILDLAKHLDTDPRSCVGSFFSRIHLADELYKAEFQQEITNFKKRIVQRAQDKLDAAIKEVEESEKQERLGPGGLDPIEVYESLPEELKNCFDLKDIPLLQQTIARMPPEEAAYHMRRCVDSGLWVPGANINESQTDA